jgi:hypothetical protein
MPTSSLKWAFFIGDLHRQIEQLHQEQYNSHDASEIFTVYRGQGLFKVDFEQMSKTKTGLMSFNNFLSTSTNRSVSLGFACDTLYNPDMVGILFVMTIDRSKSTTPFASIKDVSDFVQEDEVLFSMHTVFRIRDIKQMGEDQRLFQVDLTLTSDNDKDLRTLTERMREKTKGSTGWDRLGELLIIIGQSKKAQEVFEVMLQQTTDHDGERGLVSINLQGPKVIKVNIKKPLYFVRKHLISIKKYRLQMIVI